jgi:hypothetical protein
MVASPKKRARLEAGEPRHPWKENPSLSSRPPFEDGNTAAERHGAMRSQKLAAIAQELEEGILLEAPWCGRPAFQHAVRAWSYAEASCVLYREWFAEHGLADDEGEPLPGLVRWDRAESRASTLRQRLALDPNALASLLEKLSGTDQATSAYARQEISALRREVKQLDAQISEANERKELGA